MPTSCSHYFKETIRAAEDRGIDGDFLLAKVGLTREQVDDPGWRGDVQQLASLVQLIWYALDDELMGFLDRPAKPGTFALMAYGVLAEPSLEQALRKGVLFYQLVNSSLGMTLTEDAGCIRLGIRFSRPELDPEHYFLEFWMTIWYRLVGWLAGATPPLVKATFAYPRPVTYADELRYIFRCDHVFDAAETSLCFDRDFLQQPVVRRRAEMKKFLSVAPLGFMVVPEDETSMARRVRTLLLGTRTLPLEFPQLAEVARHLNFTEQTLRRRLREESTSYREIKENIRRDIAVQRLINSSMPVQQIGELVGYAEARAFTRAFRQWTGSSPSQYREQLTQRLRPQDRTAGS
ncbi:AraC family transcriptional regulator [Actinocorallia herbida]|uniref:AraC family transcriptional regulator n=1 Tax=Actinocorallia herbida TaxID=58109 RepID=A0A3N1D2U7_9ACTN|nr:AraC family transcriptional regulator [Actinocorallia herbida]ROO87851.1 AraC family transcriptional regulator [Actinocorallia herbida]